MSILIAILLGVAALAFVLYPLYHRRPLSIQVAQTPGTTDRTDTAVATDGEQSARSSLQEVELDYQLGNIAETDYNQLRTRYMRRALVALKARYEHEQEIDQEIEEQLRKMKEQDVDAAEEEG